MKRDIAIGVELSRAWIGLGAGLATCAGSHLLLEQEIGPEHIVRNQLSKRQPAPFRLAVFCRLALLALLAAPSTPKNHS